MALIVSIGVASYSFKEDYFEISRNLDIFTSLFRELNIYYVDETAPGDLMKKGIDAMLLSLDPYTNYIPESDIEDYRFMTTGQYGGIGALIGQKGDNIVIMEPYEGFPAQMNDIKAGDIIIEIDGKVVKGKNSDDVSKLLKGQPKTPVKITFKRNGRDDAFTKTIERDEIKIKSVPYYTALEGGVGYIRLTSFTDHCGAEVKKALLELKEKNNISSVILDLRGNPGGLLHEAVNIVNLFVDKGTEVVYTKGKVKEWDKNYKALDQPVDIKIPVAVLINSTSASASEIVAGALQDLDRAIVIGQRSFGKGLVQTTRPLSYNSQLKVTTAKYYIPSGRCIQALDYSHRNDDGSVGKIPDSLITEFKTKSGRKVFDGGGVYPDYKVELDKLSPISTSLITKYLIFDYATQYASTHTSIPAINDFQISENDYQDFLKYISDKEYDYETKSEKLMKDLKETTEKESYYQDISNEYAALNAKLQHNKTEDLKKFKAEISDLLRQEIAGRYYYQTGRMQAAFNSDTELIKASEALKNEQLYKNIMSGKEQ